MQFLSLPEEMEANVLKYSKYETLTRIRKTNQHLNRIAERYGINPNVFAALEVTMLRDETVNIEKTYHVKNVFEKEKDVYKNEDGYNLKRVGQINVDAESLIPKMKEQLENIRRVGILRLNRVTIDVNWSNVLRNFNDSETCDLVIIDCTVQIYLDDMLDINRKFKIVRIIAQDMVVFVPGDAMATDKVICALIPIATVDWTNCCRRRPIRPCPLVTNATLKMIQSTLPSTFVITNHKTSFTINEVNKTIKYAIKEVKTNHKTYWDLGYIEIGSKDEMELLASEWLAIDGFRVYKSRDDRQEARVWYGLHDILIRFIICWNE